MSRRTLILTDDLFRYLLASLPPEPSVLIRLREETAADQDAECQISPEQGQFMGLLVKLMAARSILELGTYTGYSSLCMALALPAHGRLVTCDISKERTAIARRYWKEAHVENRVELHIRPALDLLDQLLAEGRERKFDLVFIDADKENYIGYYEYALRLLRSGGLILIDNFFWSGKVIESDMQDSDTKAIRAFNAYLKNDSRVTASIVPLGDGLTLAVKN